ncbi:MAG TPA: hypothetical protein VIC54_00905 [Terriglobales bacterium]
MHLFLLILMLVCLVALLLLVGYAFWRIRRHLAHARAPGPPPPSSSAHPGGTA